MEAPSLTTNKNHLTTDSFSVVINRLPNVAFFVQKTAVPGVSTSAPEQKTPLLNIPHTGDHLYFDEFEVEFIVDENMSSWIEVWAWLMAANKRSFEEYAELSSLSREEFGQVESDIKVVINSSSQKPNIEVTLIDCIPIKLSSIELNSTQQQPTYAKATATFMYTSYEIVKL